MQRGLIATLFLFTIISKYMLSKQNSFYFLSCFVKTITTQSRLPDKGAGGTLRLARALELKTKLESNPTWVTTIS